MTTEEAEKKAQEFNVMFIETSAKAGHNVKVLFKKIAQALPGMDKDADAANGGATANKSKSHLAKLAHRTDFRELTDPIFSYLLTVLYRYRRDRCTSTNNYGGRIVVQVLIEVIRQQKQLPYAISQSQG